MATKWENQGSEIFCTPLLKSGNFLCPPFNMAKTSSYCIKTTPKYVVTPPPFSMAKTCSAPISPPFSVGVKLRMSPLRSPPPRN